MADWRASLLRLTRVGDAKPVRKLDHAVALRLQALKVQRDLLRRSCKWCPRHEGEKGDRGGCAAGARAAPPQRHGLGKVMV